MQPTFANQGQWPTGLAQHRQAIKDEMNTKWINLIPCSRPPQDIFNKEVLFMLSTLPGGEAKVGGAYMKKGEHMQIVLDYQLSTN